jgi:hypothetical protein
MNIGKKRISGKIWLKNSKSQPPSHLLLPVGLLSKKLPGSFVSEFYQAIETGIKNRKDSIALSKNTAISNEVIFDYPDNPIS